MENLVRVAESLGSQQDIQTVLDGVTRLAQLSSSRIARPFRPYSANALTKLSQTSEDRKLAILGQIKTLENILSEPEIETPGSNHPEWSLIKNALSLYELKLKDDFQNILQKDDVIEIYSTDHLQLFRTFNFYEYSAYTYLDLILNEWFNLWERPKSLIEFLMEVGQAVVTGKRSGIVSMEHIPQHVYKEIYNSEDKENFEARSVLCKFGHISPLYKPDDSIGGFIINCRVKVLQYGEETKQLSFI